MIGADTDLIVPVDSMLRGRQLIGIANKSGAQQHASDGLLS